MPALLTLPTIRIAGTPATMGQAYGKALRGPIAAYIDQRMRAARVYLRERGIRDGQAFRAIGADCLQRLRGWDLDAWVEHQATADAAGVDAVDLYTAGNMTDVRDVLALGRMSAESEGCTSALVPAAHSRDGAVIVGQTWDLNPTDLDFVVAVHRVPDDGPETWAITCAGCPSIVGMNQHGVAVGTTNIKTRGSRPGIPYLSLLHRMIRCPDRQTAGQLLQTAPRAAAHTYWIADAGGVGDWECTATAAVFREGTAPLCRTNHCLDPSHQAIEGEPATASSQARLVRAQSWLATPQDADSLRQLFADRADGVDSINRFTEDGQGTSTNACVIAIPAQRELQACRGSADRGAWIRLPFERTPQAT